MALCETNCLLLEIFMIVIQLVSSSLKMSFLEPFQCIHMKEDQIKPKLYQIMPSLL